MPRDFAGDRDQLPAVASRFRRLLRRNLRRFVEVIIGHLQVVFPHYRFAVANPSSVAPTAPRSAAGRWQLRTGGSR